MIDIYQGITIFLAFFSLVIGGFAFVVWSKIDKAAIDAEQAKRDAVEKSDRVKDELAEFKLHVAREHPIRDELTNISNKMEAGFKEILEKIDKVSVGMNNMGIAFRDMLNDKEDKK
jgi:hypothetical protein